MSCRARPLLLTLVLASCGPSAPSPRQPAPTILVERRGCLGKLTPPPPPLALRQLLVCLEADPEAVCPDPGAEAWREAYLGLADWAALATRVDGAHEVK